MVQLRTVQTLQEVIHNILHFNGEFGADSRVSSRLALFRHWYHVPLLGLFGPEKFIGHVKQTGGEASPLSASEYMEHADLLDNFDPKPTLREWFRPATEEEEFRLRLELAYVLGRRAREPNGVIYMYVLRD
jgi:hypothetical protein